MFFTSYIYTAHTVHKWIYTCQHWSVLVLEEEEGLLLTELECCILECVNMPQNKATRKPTIPICSVNSLRT